MAIASIVKYLGGTALLLLNACGEASPLPPIDKLFTLMPAGYTHIDFENRLVDEPEFNVFKYRNYYNGGGVAIGDINNDGLPDIYLTANRQKNRLYINQGDFRFRDVTRQARVAGSHGWSTGVSMVDINGDRLLDIYVCNSGIIKGDNRANELFINQGVNASGVPTFKEAAAEYGLADEGFSTHAAFFDYDRDGDLDMYLLNNSFRALTTFNLSRNLRHERDPGGGDRLYRNDDGHFVDVSAEAGIHGSVIGFGLGLSVADVNGDQWLDIYVANDFFERDYLYINNRDGTFTDKLEELMGHVSLASMGSDIADLNNDGFPEIYTTDMLPEDDYRLKTTFTFESDDLSRKKLKWGYYHQMSRNMLHLNRGRNRDGQVRFSEIGLLAGVAATDWTWGVMMVDLDNDGLKDIFISNGIFRDVTNQDYIEFLGQKENIRQIMSGKRVDFSALVEKAPSTPLANYAFHNEGDLTFSNRAEEWGLDMPSFSNGAAYGDLDGDGDNDLIINNVNQPVYVLRNESDSLRHNHYLKVDLIGSGKNSYAIGANVALNLADGQILTLEQMPMRVFQSSVDYGLTFGLGDITLVDSLVVDWPDGARQVLRDISADQAVTLRQADAPSNHPAPPATPRPLFKEITGELPLQHRHVENDFVDYHREPLIPRLLSIEGPKMARADINGDGLDDLYIGGAKGSAGRLLIQTAKGEFISTNEALLRQSLMSEDVGVIFFDRDGDGDLDLYVVSGGNEYSTRSPALLDRLYINDGRGGMSLSETALPEFYASGSCVAAADFDGDGDMDLFVGSRSIPWKYGLTPESYLLQNDGAGTFSIVTATWAPGLADVGMVTDAEWFDYDNDGRPDLVVVGEWMPVTIFRNTGHSLTNITAQAGLGETQGWWNRVIVEDMNGDGYLDLVAGNWGENSRIQASVTEPVTIYISDFDGNGLIEPIMAFTNEGQIYPMPLRQRLVNQLPYLKSKIPTHADYAGKQIAELFESQQLASAVIKHANLLATTLFLGSAEGTFSGQPLPSEVQYSPVYAIIAQDFDGDGIKDLLLAGNFHGVGPQIGRQDASYGTLLKGAGDGAFIPLSILHSGLAITGQVRDILSLKYRGDQELFIIANNNAPIQVYSMAGR
ncbi:MAG: VCBS repeat-containing protein [Candidatus Marinimicrobia bacterium]|nr:VCBS repeat-containing protein [Candidatus Neomarinimicrobiota bacterium]